MKYIVTIIVLTCVIFVLDPYAVCVKLPSANETEIDEITTKEQNVSEDNRNLLEDLNTTTLEKQALEVSTPDALLENSCKPFGTCEFNILLDIPVCYCDEACPLLNDCCFDYPHPKKDENSFQGLQSVMEFVTCETNQNHFMFNFHFSTGSYTISKCPTEYPLEEVSLKCHYGEYFPVSTADGITYRNVYCAYCHGKTDYTAWQLHHSGCLNGSNLDKSISAKIRHIINGSCEYYFIPPLTIDVRYCTLYDEETQTSDTMKLELCNSFLNPVVTLQQGTQTAYRNIFCLQNDDEYRHCSKGVSIDDVTGPEDVKQIGIFNIRPAMEMSGHKYCSSDEYYSALSDSCIPTHCNRSKGDTSCSIELVKNFVWETSKVSFITNALVGKDLITRVAVFFYLSLPHERYGLQFRSLTGRFVCGNSSIYSERSCCIFGGSAEFTMTIAETYESIEDFSERVDKISWNYTEILNNRIVNAQPFQRDETNETCGVDGTNSTGKELGVGVNEVNSYEESLLYNDINRSRLRVAAFVKGTVFIREAFDGIQVFRIKEWEFLYRTSTIPRFPSKLSPEEWSASTILTYVTMGISCISLFVTMILYKVLGLSSSPPGIISQNMMGTLLAAQFLFLVGGGANDIRALCLTIGVALHYLWLCSFTWSSVFLFNVLKMMRQLYSTPGKLSRDQKLSKIIPLVAYMLPMLIVLPCLFLDLFSDIDIGYADNLCFPTGFPANIYAFTVPVLTSLIFNIIALCITSCSISRFNNTAQLTNSVQKIRSFIPIYIRLCMLCACPWLIGMMANLFQSEVLGYIFIFLAGSQGTFVAISFLTGKSVTTKIKSKWSKPSLSRQQTTATTS